MPTWPHTCTAPSSMSLFRMPHAYTAARVTPTSSASSSTPFTSSVLSFTTLPSSYSSSSSSSSYPVPPRPLSLPWFCGSVVVPDIDAVYRLTEQLPKYFSASSRTVFPAGCQESAIVVWLINWRGVFSAGTTIAFLVLLVRLYNKATTTL